MNYAQYYILDKNGNPSPEENMEAISNFLRYGDRNVAKSRLGKYFVSTVFLCLNHGYLEDYPILYETMVFKNKWRDLYCDRCSTKEEAMIGHERAVALVRSWLRENAYVDSQLMFGVLTAPVIWLLVFFAM